MRTLNRELTFLVLSLLAGIALYWQSFSGTPIWDDRIYLFDHPIKDTVSFIRIFTHFAWPVSVAFQKLELLLFKDNYFLYHITNFTIHFINSSLLYFMLKKHDIKYAKWVFLLFFLHPASVISVGWIIQLKTLLSFLFAILSVHFFLRSIKEEHSRTKLLCLCLFFFLLSFFSKPASVLIPVFYFFYILYKKQLKQYLPVILFTIIVAVAGSYKTLSRSQAILEETPSGRLVKQDFTDASVRALKSAHYYFWQSLLPIDTAPVKGKLDKDLNLIHWVHLFFLITITVICFKFHKLWPFIFGHVMLFPFLGFVVAPYMTITWVSDQHLYLVLPFFLLFLTRVLNFNRPTLTYTILSSLLVFFSFKTYETNKFFKNDINFFEASYRSNPLNMSAALNLSNAYIQAKQFDEALKFIDQVTELGMSDKAFRNDPYFVYILVIKLELNQRLKR